MNRNSLRDAETEWIGFGPFVLHFKERTLARDGKPIELSPRALELLIALLEQPGTVLTKDQLIERIWHDRSVAEVNLRVAVAALRKSLTGAAKDSYIVSSTGRGYAFSNDVHLEYWPPRGGGTDRPGTEAVSALQGRLPLLLKPVIGRDETVAKIIGSLDRGRLVSIVGAAGIGKTTVAIAAASGAPNEIRFVDYAPVRDESLVVGRIAACLAPDRVDGDPLRIVIDALAGRQVLIVLDNCEHLLGSIGQAATAILQSTPDVKILATSREPLHVDGEIVHRLEGLRSPEESFAGDAQQALEYPAIRLLVDRIRAVNPDFVLAGDLVKPAAEICRRLDGIALAVQLAAARVETFGLVQVASRLNDRFDFLGRGTQTALPRHQTLDAAISWSFELLDADERLVCARLSTFSGEFSLDAAIDVAGWAPLSAHRMTAIVAALVEKSLIVFVADSARPRYIFLETIRDFARRRLPLIDAGNELLAKFVQRLIVDCDLFTDLIRRGEVAEATGFARRRMDDLRYAIERSFEVGDAALQSALLVRCAPLMLHLGNIFELTDWVGRALGSVTDARERLPLLMPYARALGLSRPNLAMQVSLYEEAVEIAQGLGDRESELRARWGLSYLSGPGYGPRRCLEAGLAFRDRARAIGDASATFIAETLQGWALHDLGDFEASMEVHRGVIDRYSPETSAADASRFGLNHRAVSMCDLSEGYWQIGRLEEAEAWNQASIQEAGDHLPTLFIPLSQRLGRTLHVSSDWTDISQQFDDLSRRFNVDGRWKAWIRNLSAIIEIHQHRTETALSRLDGNILLGQWQGLTNRYIWIVVPIIRCCLILGKMDLARKLACQLVSEKEAMECLWFLPEALRLKALSLVDFDKAAAAACFDEARRCAAKLGAASFAEDIEASYKAARSKLISNA